MPSEEFRAFQEAAAARPVPPPPASLQELRERIDANMGGLPLAEGIEAVEHDVDGIRVIECVPTGAPLDIATVLYLHGGGFRMASALAYRSYGSHIAKVAGARVVLADYRLAPEHPYPAALDDSEAVYRWLIARGTPASRIVVGGDSAGGGLTASVALRSLANGPAPAGLVCLSPWVDLTLSGETWDANAATDFMFNRTAAEAAAPLYLDGHDATDPGVSPLFGTWAGVPPMLIQVGSGECLVGDARRLAAAVTAVGGEVTLREYDGMPHVWQMSYPAFPEAVEAIEEIGAFVRRHAG